MLRSIPSGNLREAAQGAPSSSTCRGRVASFAAVRWSRPRQRWEDKQLNKGSKQGQSNVEQCVFTLFSVTCSMGSPLGCCRGVARPLSDQHRCHAPQAARPGLHLPASYKHSTTPTTQIFFFIYRGAFLVLLATLQQILQHQQKSGCSYNALSRNIRRTSRFRPPASALRSGSSIRQSRNGSM